MADIIPDGWAEVTIPHTHAALGRSAAVVFGVRVPETPIEPNAFAQAVQIVYSANLGSGIDSQVVIGPAEARIGTSTGENLVGVADETSVGNRAGDAAPGNCSILLHKRSNRGGRRGRGRMYVPWSLLESDVDEVGRVTQAARTAWNTRANNLLTAMINADFPMVILHSAGQTVPGNPNLVTSLLSDAVLGSQRRRLGR